MKNILPSDSFNHSINNHNCAFTIINNHLHASKVMSVTEDSEGQLNVKPNFFELNESIDNRTIRMKSIELLHSKIAFDQLISNPISIHQWFEQIKMDSKKHNFEDILTNEKSLKKHLKNLIQKNKENTQIISKSEFFFALLLEVNRNSKEISWDNDFLESMHFNANQIVQMPNFTESEIWIRSEAKKLKRINGDKIHDYLDQNFAAFGLFA